MPNFSVVGRPDASIASHAAIGDCRSAALVGLDGAIDWLCWPRFDSPALFAKLLDPDGGAFSVAPAGDFTASRSYLEGTNVLETRFAAARGVLVLQDAMTMAGEEAAARSLLPQREILRIARCVQGEVELEVVLDPRPDFGRGRRRWRDGGARGLFLDLGPALLVFRSEPRLPLAPSGAVRARLRLRAGEVARFSLSHADEQPAVLPPLGDRAEDALRRTAACWRSWTRGITYDGPFVDAVVRSALVLKLLAYAPSGAIVAAATTSLPERLGGFLNWDYRYCWLRDASLTIRALAGLGVEGEADGFLGWLLHTTRLTWPALRVVYDVFGREPPRERELPLRGYAGSRPVRVGNAAKDQLQLDVYGEVIDATSQLVPELARLDRETCRMLRGVGDYVARRWREPDEGLWEPREPRAHHTHSKLLCWVALDRLLDLHRRGHLPRLRADALAREREAIRAAIERDGYHPGLASYTATFGGTEVDAALLQMPRYGYVPADAPRMRSTVRRIEAELSAGRGLLHRYRASPDWREGAFGACGFWAAEYLARGGGSADEAEARIASLLGFANDVGLFAEESDPASGEPLGNFPQAFTHVGLVNACLTLRDRLAARRAPGRASAAAATGGAP